MAPTSEQQKSLDALEQMFKKDELTGRETPSQVRNFFLHLFSDPVPDTKVWARRFNAVRKKCHKRPVDLIDRETLGLSPTHSFTPQKRKPSAEVVLDTDSDEEDSHFETPNEVKPVTTSLEVCHVNLDHEISYWDDPDSPQFFISVVLFLQSGVPSSSVEVSVPSSKNRICYSYDRPLPARDGDRLYRRWTRVAPGFTAMLQYHPFVKGFHQYFKRFCSKDDEIIRSHGSMHFDDGITVEETIHENISLKFSAESTNAIIITMRQTNVDKYKQANKQRHEVEA